MKRVLVKVFSAADVYLGMLTKVDVHPFGWAIDDGQGECVIDLGEKFDFVSPLIQLNNNFEVHVFNAADATGSSKVVYAGYLSLIERQIGSKEGITLHLLGHHTKLAIDVLRNGTTTTMTYSNAYLGAIFADVLTKYRANTVNPKVRYDDGYTVSSVMLPQITYKFEEKTYREALDTLRGYAANGEFYRFDPDGTCWFRKPSTLPDRLFTHGKHFTSLKVVQSLEKVRTQVLFWNGVPSGATMVYKKYSADTYQTALGYGARVERHFDYGVTNTVTADALAARFLKDASIAPIEISVRILDDSALTPHTGPAIDRQVGFDIESIYPGDTCRFQGFDETKIDFLTDNMLITSVVYGFDWVDLKIDVFRSGFSPWQKAVATEIAKLSTSGMPTLYAT